LGFRVETIPYAAHRQKVFRMRRLRLDVAAQAHHEIIDGARVGVLVQAPDVFEHGLP